MPVIVIVELPVDVLPVVVTVRVERPDIVTVAGLKVAVAPVGSPLTVNVTIPVNPPSAPIVTV